MNDIQLKAHFIHGLSNKTRLTILELLKLKEMTVNEIVEQSKISQSSISQHLACLKGCGLLFQDKRVNLFIIKLRTIRF